jgi:hypothetical protein
LTIIEQDALIIVSPALFFPGQKDCLMKLRLASYRLAAAAVVAALFSSAADAGTYVFDFANDLDGWQQQWHKESESGSPGFVNHTTERGYNDSASLEFDMGDGLGDDGTLWIERLFNIEPSVPTLVSVDFQQFSPVQSDLNNFEIKAAISTTNPNEQADFTTIGATGSIAGWALFAHDQLIASPTGEVWVAVGIRVAWESPRVYGIDHVVVTTSQVPEPSSLLVTAVAGAAWVGWRRIWQ